jgi:hypothetical protein
VTRSGRNSKPLSPLPLILPGVLFALLTAACAGGPGGRDLPSWVISPPVPDDTYEYFVVSAEDPDGNYARAEEAAGLNLLSEIDRVLGVDVSVITDAEVRGGLDSYEAEVRSAVRQVGSGTIAGLRVVDRYVQDRGDSIIIYVLASYERSELQREQSRRRALVAEREDAVALPERRGEEAEGRGQLFEAFRWYVNAAVAASASDISNADVKRSRNMENALRALGNMRFENRSQPGELFFAQPVTEEFVALIRSRDGRPVPDAPVIASYQETVNGRSRQVNEVLISDGQGLLGFTPGSSGSPGTRFLTFYLDISAELEQLRSAGLANDPQFGAIENLAADLRVRFEYEVVSMAPNIPTAVVFLEQDIAGMPIASSGLRDGVLQELAAFDFRIIELTPEALERLADSENALRQWVRDNYAGQVQRLVFGTASIVEVDERDGFIVKVEGSLQVFDFEEGRVMVRTSGIKNSRGTSSSRAVSSAFFNLGRDFGSFVLNNLP